MKSVALLLLVAGGTGRAEAIATVTAESVLQRTAYYFPTRLKQREDEGE